MGLAGMNRGALGAVSDRQRQAKFSAGHPSKKAGRWRAGGVSGSQEKIESAKF